MSVLLNVLPMPLLTRRGSPLNRAPGKVCVNYDHQRRNSKVRTTVGVGCT